MGPQRWYSQKMAHDRLPLHLCNSIKQYCIEKNNLNSKIVLIRDETANWRKKFNLRLDAIERIKLVLLLVLLLTQNTCGNSFGSGRNSMLRTRIIGTRYGKLQGVILPMDQHKYLKPVEAYLGVPYATPPTGSNRYVQFQILI